MLDDIQLMAARAAVNKMMRDGYLSICVIDNILKMTGGIPARKDYELLHTLHCVHFMDMDVELLRGLPLIIQRVISSEDIKVEFTQNIRALLVK